jgi:hypothetical protein
MGAPSTTTVKRDGPYLGRVRVVDGIRNGADIFPDSGSLKVTAVDSSGGTAYPESSTNAWIESTTAGSFVLATTVASNAINIVAMKANCTAAASFELRSALSTTLSPSISVAASVTEDWNLTNINGAPWFKTVSGESLEIVIPSYAGNSDNPLKVFIVTTNS